MSEAATTRKCKSCGEWYDARAAACYICGEEDREENYALKKAEDTSRLNGALSKQLGFAQADAGAERLLNQGKRSGNYHSGSLAVPGYKTLVGSIKQALAEQGFGER